MTQKAHKEHFLVETHGPEEFASGGKEHSNQAMADYLEGKLSDGYELVSVVSSDSNWRFVFKATGK